MNTIYESRLTPAFFFYEVAFEETNNPFRLVTISLAKEDKTMEDNRYEDNKYIKMAAEEFAKERSKDNLFRMFDVLLKRMMDDGEVRTPMVDVNNVFGSFKLEDLDKGDTFTIDQEMRLRIDTVSNGNGNEWIPLYTDEDEMNAKPTTNVTINLPICKVLKAGLEDGVEGIVINPFGLALTMPKDVLKIVVDRYEELQNSNKEE